MGETKKAGMPSLSRNNTAKRPGPSYRLGRIFVTSVSQMRMRRAQGRLKCTSRTGERVAVRLEHGLPPQSLPMVLGSALLAAVFFSKCPCIHMADHPWLMATPGRRGHFLLPPAGHRGVKARRQPFRNNTVLVLIW